MHTLALFDIDGTLVRGSRLHKKSIHAALKEVYGVEAEVDEIDHSGMVDKQIMLTLLGLRGIGEEAALGKLDSAIEVMCRHFISNLQDGEIEALPGAFDLIHALSEKNVGLGLVTGNAKSIAYEKVKAIHLSRSFRFGGFGDEALTREPLVPLAIERAEELFGRRFVRERIFLIGDTPRDIMVARHAGIRSIGVATGRFSSEDLKRQTPTHVTENLEDTGKIVGYITRH